MKRERRSRETRISRGTLQTRFTCRARLAAWTPSHAPPSHTLPLGLRDVDNHQGGKGAPWVQAADWSGAARVR